MRELPDRSQHYACVVLRLGLGFLWIYEGLILKLLLPLSDLERDVVAASGLIPNGFEEWLLHSLGVLEILLGLLLLLGVRLRLLCLAQIIVVGLFTLLIPFQHPATLAHPFGLLIKNIPILAAVIALWLLQKSPDKKTEKT
jgi:uncharacterized membrane protein YphA (DoxX/SURF4 family)